MEKIKELENSEELSRVSLDVTCWHTDRMILTDSLTREWLYGGGNAPLILTPDLIDGAIFFHPVAYLVDVSLILWRDEFHSSARSAIAYMPVILASSQCAYLRMVPDVDGEIELPATVRRGIAGNVANGAVRLQGGNLVRWRPANFSDSARGIEAMFSIWAGVVASSLRQVELAHALRIKV